MLLQELQDNNLSFLKEKIQEIKHAMFKAEIDSVLQLPNNIITTTKIDDDGSIWFYTSCSGLYAENIDKHFYAYLDFHQKGNGQRIKLGGKASVIDDNYAKLKGGILIKYKILQAEYFENKQDVKYPSVKERIKHLLTDWFMAESYKTFNFTETV